MGRHRIKKQKVHTSNFFQWSLFVPYLYFYIFHLLPLLIFFHNEKEDKLSSFFYIKRTQAYRKKAHPSLQLFFDSCAHQILSVPLSLRVIGISSFNQQCLFCCWNQGIHESSLISESATLFKYWIKAYILF